MEIVDAFDSGVIEQLGVGLNEEEEGALEEWLVEVVTDFANHEENKSLQPVDMAVSISAVAFVAGRAFQTQYNDANVVSVEMDSFMLAEFLEFTLEKIRRLSE